MNRHRKTGTYIRPDNALIESGLYNEITVALGGTSTVVAPTDEYGAEYDQEEEYEGGEAELNAVDEQTVDQERIKESVELTKYQDFYNIIFT